METFFTQARTLKEIALYYGVGRSTMRRWLTVAGIKTPIGRRMYTPKEMLKIREEFGSKEGENAW